MQGQNGNGGPEGSPRSPIDEAIESAEEKAAREKFTAEMEVLGEEARRTFPKDWKLRLFHTPAGVMVSVEFVVATKATAQEALRAAIDDYKAAAAAQPEDAKRVTGRIFGIDGKPLA